MKLRDGQWIVEAALPDARALSVASVNEVLAQLPKADVAEVLDSFELLEPGFDQSVRCRASSYGTGLI